MDDFEPQDGNDLATLLPKDDTHKKFFPTFPSWDPSSVQTEGVVNGNKYCAMGLGYRRCPGEVFNYFFAMKMMEVLNEINVEYRGTQDQAFKLYIFNPLDPTATENQAFNDGVPIGIQRTPDNWFTATD